MKTRSGVASGYDLADFSIHSSAARRPRLIYNPSAGSLARRASLILPSVVVALVFFTSSLFLWFSSSLVSRRHKFHVSREFFSFSLEFYMKKHLLSIFVFLLFLSYSILFLL